MMCINMQHASHQCLEDDTTGAGVLILWIGSFWVFELFMGTTHRIHVHIQGSKR